ncbi:MAG: 2-hydroxymuconate tautomerase [Pseudomonadota bacterium]|nr:tautomerase family protein [Pseudomonadota bacterium]
MPLIHVEMFAGRTREQKRELAQALTETCVRVTGCAPEVVTILFQDVDKQDWAVAGEVMADKFPD